MKKITSTLLTVLIVAAIIVSMAKSQSLASKIFSFTFFILLIFLIRNISIPKKIFKYRFYWHYPFLMTVLMFLIYIIKNDKPRDFNFLITLECVGFGIGLIWGIRERLRIKKNNHKCILAERIDLITEDSEALDKRGTLLLTTENKVIFISKDKSELKINSQDIKSISVKSIAKIFPVYIEIILTSEKKYIVNSDFPFVWEKALNDLQNLKL